MVYTHLPAACSRSSTGAPPATTLVSPAQQVSLSMVTGDHSTNPVPPSRNVQLNSDVQLDSQSVVGAEVPGRLRLTKLPLLSSTLTPPPPCFWES
eukprot:530089-Prorocentrum_minimum.AAC.1